MSENLVPILLDIPESFETERLLIRAGQPGDGVEMNDVIGERYTPRCGVLNSDGR